MLSKREEPSIVPPTLNELDSLATIKFQLEELRPSLESLGVDHEKPLKDKRLQ